jgi:hypothetical protein
MRKRQAAHQFHEPGERLVRVVWRLRHDPEIRRQQLVWRVIDQPEPGANEMFAEQCTRQPGLSPGKDQQGHEKELVELREPGRPVQFRQGPDRSEIRDPRGRSVEQQIPGVRVLEAVAGPGEDRGQLEKAERRAPQRLGRPLAAHRDEGDALVLQDERKFPRREVRRPRRHQPVIEPAIALRDLEHRLNIGGEARPDAAQHPPVMVDDPSDRIDE